MSRIAFIIGGDISKKHHDILGGVDVYTHRTLQEAANLAVRLESEHKADALVGPSGTAAEIEKHVSLPVIHCDPSAFDLLETLCYAERITKSSEGKIGLVLHSSRANMIDVRKYQPFLKNRLLLFSYTEESDIVALVNQLAIQGVSIIVGGPTTLQFSNMLGINSFILRLGREAIRMAIEKAEDIIRISEKNREQSQRLSTAVNLFADGVMVLDGAGRIMECNGRASTIFGIPKEQILRMHIEDISNDKSWGEVYKHGLQHLDRLVEMQTGNLFTTRKPIIVDGKVQGAVATFQEVHKIEKLEQKYRKYQARGFVAKFYFKDIIGKSTAMVEAIDRARAFAQTDSLILIQGETGTGKEMFAQSIHNCSERRKGPFVAINCAALPENLLESELMGYEEGAFTGAKRGGKAGLFEHAHTGTMFLDEINRMPIQLQSRILRVLQEKQVLRLGGERMIPVDVRIVAATNEDLRSLVQQSCFREDLYYRLKVLDINVPPLRTRKGDIAPLTEYYFGLFVNKYGAAAPLSDEAMRMLESHSWPGNIRELINCLERYVIVNRQLGTSDIRFVTDYLLAEQQIGGVPDYEDSNAICVKLGTLSNMEQQLIDTVLKRNEDNKLYTATVLGISRTTLWKKIKSRKDADV